MLKIVALVKFTPDSTGDRRFGADLTVDRAGTDGVLSELDEYTVERAIALSESGEGGEITYLTMGPADAIGALRKALSMGGDRAIHLLDDGLHGSDAWSTAVVLATALRRLEFDIVLTGMASTDAGMGVVPSMLAEMLGLTQISHAGTLTVTDRVVQIERDLDTVSYTVRGRLPALVSVTDRSGDPRYPSFKGIMAGKKKPVTVWDLGDLEIPANQVGLTGSKSQVMEAVPRPPRQAGVLVKDDGDGGVKLAEFLSAHQFI